MLISFFEHGCVMVERTSVPDGEGGQHTTWTEGQHFTAAIVRNETAENEVADKRDIRNRYTITTAHDLKHDDVFKRVSDGEIFRVTSNSKDVQTPSCASFSFKQCYAEEWALT